MRAGIAAAAFVPKAPNTSATSPGTPEWGFFNQGMSSGTAFGTWAKYSYSSEMPNKCSRAGLASQLVNAAVTRGDSGIDQDKERRAMLLTLTSGSSKALQSAPLRGRAAAGPSS